MKLNYGIIFLLLIHACTPEVLSPKVEDYLVQIGSLPDQIHESSGLAADSIFFWTINDSGSEADLFQVDVFGNLKSRRFLQGVSSVDWESACVSGNKLFIGDFGNNFGTRTDLAVHAVLLNDLHVGLDTISSTSTHIFNYPDQQDFSSRPQEHNFDCEAMISFNDLLFLFTKNHLDKACKIYSLNPELTDQEAAYLTTFNTNGTITGAALHPDGADLFLLGYTKEDGDYSTFIWHFYDYVGDQFFSGSRFRLDLPVDRQLEGLEVGPSYQLFFTSEAEGSSPGLLYGLDFMPWLN